jgi:hypothetical protein
VDHCSYIFPFLATKFELDCLLLKAAASLSFDLSDGGDPDVYQAVTVIQDRLATTYGEIWIRHQLRPFIDAHFRLAEVPLSTLSWFRDEIRSLIPIFFADDRATLKQAAKVLDEVIDDGFHFEMYADGGDGEGESKLASVESPVDPSDDPIPASQTLDDVLLTWLNQLDDRSFQSLYNAMEHQNLSSFLAVYDRTKLLQSYTCSNQARKSNSILFSNPSIPIGFSENHSAFVFVRDVPSALASDVLAELRQSRTQQVLLVAMAIQLRKIVARVPRMVRSTSMTPVQNDELRCCIHFLPAMAGSEQCSTPRLREIARRVDGIIHSQEYADWLGSRPKVLLLVCNPQLPIDLRARLQWFVPGLNYQSMLETLQETCPQIPHIQNSGELRPKQGVIFVLFSLNGRISRDGPGIIKQLLQSMYNIQVSLGWTAILDKSKLPV